SLAISFIEMVVIGADTKQVVARYKAPHGKILRKDRGRPKQRDRHHQKYFRPHSPPPSRPLFLIYQRNARQAIGRPPCSSALRRGGSQRTSPSCRSYCVEGDTGRFRCPLLGVKRTSVGSIGVFTSP